MMMKVLMDSFDYTYVLPTTYALSRAPQVVVVVAVRGGVIT
jgi:hypothetical protein